MSRLAATIVTTTVFFCTVFISSAAPRVALVKVAEIYHSLPSTISMNQEIARRKELLAKDQRVEKIRTTLAEFQTLRSRVSSEVEKMDQETRNQAVDKLRSKQEELETIQKDFQEFSMAEEKEIKAALLVEMKKSLKEILDYSQKFGQEKGYDLVIDSSGETNTTLPFVIYSKASPDLTEEIKTALLAKNPSQAPVTPAPAKP